MNSYRRPVSFSGRIALAFFLVAAVAASAAARSIPMVEVEGAIGPVVAEYVADALDEIAQSNHPFAIVRVDTPGGLDPSMRQIVQKILVSPVPVVAWVGPSGARAASAGLFIVAAAHVAAMAPGTNLGAAHPVAIGGGSDETMAKKAEEDAAAYIRSLAQQRGRDPAWFEKAVVESRSVSAEEALGMGVVDLIAPDVEELLRALDGRTVKVGAREIRLSASELHIQPVPMNWRQRILQVVSEPNIAYLLLLLGFYGLFFELANPGSILPGVLGGLFLILAFVGMQTIPFNYAGVLLMLLGLVLLLLEIKVTSFGLLTVGGAVSLTLGSLLLFKSTEAYERLSFGVVIPAVAATVAFFLFAVGKGIAAQRVKPVSGLEGLLGERGRALDPLVPGQIGKVFVHGEYWNAKSEAEVPKGEEVEVLGVRGMELTVGPVGPERRI